MDAATGPSPRKFTGRKIAFLAVGALLLVAVTAASLYFRYALPIGRGPAGPALAREAFAAPGPCASILVVGLGDSVTAGFGARTGYGYFDRVVTNAPEDAADVKGLSPGGSFAQSPVHEPGGFRQHLDRADQGPTAASAQRRAQTSSASSWSPPGEMT